MASESSMCSRCSKLDLLNLFAKADEILTGSFPSMPPLDEHGHIEYPERSFMGPLAHPTILLQTKSERVVDIPGQECFVCKFFRDVLTQLGYKRGDCFEDITVYSSTRLCRSILDASKLPPEISTKLSQLHYIDRGFISFTENETSGLYNRDFICQSEKRRAIFRALKPDESVDDRACVGICGRIVPKWVDFRIPKRWLEFCKSSHAPRCSRPRPNKELPGFRLINCHLDPITIEPNTLNADYVALSYVWAASPQPSSGLPDVVSHAMEVTRQLGFQYLWIDRFCIDQTNDAEKAHQISNMHLIFQQAEVTLVAAVDDFDGLSGVSVDGSNKLARTVQQNLRLGDTTLVTIPDPKLAIWSSKWYQRGWTFQEALLSRRVLVFTDSQLYWNCCSMHAYECLYIPAEISHLSDMTQHGEWMSSGIFDRTSRGNIEHLQQTDTPVSLDFTCGLKSDTNIINTICMEIMDDIFRYSRRYLTNDNDSLDAFKGIMQMHRGRAGNKIKFVLGIPVVMIPNVDLNSIFAYALSDWSVYSGFPLCIPFQHRRHHMPSWSWAGWTDAVYWESQIKKEIYCISSHDRIYSFYSPRLKLISRIGNRRVEVSIETAVEETWSFDKFSTLRIAKPYIVKDKKLFFEVDILQAPISAKFDSPEDFYTDNVTGLLIYCDMDDPYSSRFLILRQNEPNRDGKKTWERVGQASLKKDEIIHGVWRDGDVMDRWETMSTFEDLVEAMGLMQSSIDYFIE